jgi:hypothetical protein
MTRDLADVVALAARDPLAYVNGLDLESRGGMFKSLPLLSKTHC